MIVFAEMKGELIDPNVINPFLELFRSNVLLRNLLHAYLFHVFCMSISSGLLSHKLCRIFHKSFPFLKECKLVQLYGSTMQLE